MVVREKKQYQLKKHVTWQNRLAIAKFMIRKGLKG